MATFCGKCGAILAEQAAFCGKCGARKPAPNPSAAQQPVPPQGNVVPTGPAKSNTLLKVVVAVVAVLGIGGVLALAGVFYAAHKVSEKAHAVLGDKARSAPGGLASLLKGAGGSDDDTTFKGDPCRFLSTEDVSHAAGIPVIRTERGDAGCTYIAHGDPADMTSKHMAAMATSQAKANGQTVDAKQQQMMQQITGAFFKQQESSDKDLSAAAATGEVPVLTVSFSSGNADLEMKMNRMAFNHIKQGGMASTDGKSTDQTATGDLAGIGDDAYEMGGTGLLVRKGKTVAHFMFPQCPCNADAIKPLAEKVANQL